MKYGFTPGMGATYIVPEKLGIVLGEEMLFTAANFSGAALEKRGVPFEVLPKKTSFKEAANWPDCWRINREPHWLR